MLDKKSETFVIYITALKTPLGLAKKRIYSAQAAQITALKQEEAPTEVLSKYVDYTDVFSFDLAMELPENIGINEHAIKLEISKQPPYGLIYSQRPVEMETLKIYIKTHLKTRFIQTSKSLAGAPILFDKKPDGSLWLCVDYQGLNKLTIKS